MKGSMKGMRHKDLEEEKWGGEDLVTAGILGAGIGSLLGVVVSKYLLK